jgi:hypothetical protein
VVCCLRLGLGWFGLWTNLLHDGCCKGRAKRIDNWFKENVEDGQMRCMYCDCEINHGTFYCDRECENGYNDEVYGEFKQ